MIFDITPIIAFLNAHTANSAHEKESTSKVNDSCEEETPDEAAYFFFKLVLRSVRFALVIALLFMFFCFVMGCFS